MSGTSLLRQAEALKASVAETSKGSPEAWVKRQELQDLYQRLLVVDLEYALDKKVEQELWNHAFKNQITTFQGQVKDKTNPKRGEIQASLNLFLETASGFYLQLLQELCSAFELDLPFRKKAATIGILKEYGPAVTKVKVPTHASCLYICQHCLVHLGDVARYRQQVEQSQTYYRHAANLVPSNGQPYNQLAILEAAKGNKLSNVFFYLRSVAVKHPFPVAATNLEKLYTKISKDSHDVKGKLSMNEIIAVFLQFHALVHQSTDLNRAKSLSEKIVLNLTTHITSLSFTSQQLLHMVAINLFALHHAKAVPGNESSASSSSSKMDKRNGNNNNKQLSRDEQTAYDMVFNLTLHFFDLMLQCTPRQETKAREYHTLPAIKAVMDWFHTDREILSHPAFKSFTIIWPNLARTLNNLQFSANQKPVELEKNHTIPLPEDNDLQCFLPIEKAHRYLEMERAPPEGLGDELEQSLRCHRLLLHGLWICDEFPSLNLLNVQKLKTGRLQFTAPTPHVKVLQAGTDAEGIGHDRTTTVRQNVAIQAIMQNKSKKPNAPASNESVTTATSTPSAKEREDSSNKPQPRSSPPEHHSTHDTGMMTQAIPLSPSDPRLQRHFTGGGPDIPVLPVPPHRGRGGGAGVERFPMGIPPSLEPPQPRTALQRPPAATSDFNRQPGYNEHTRRFPNMQQPNAQMPPNSDTFQKLKQNNEAFQKMQQQNEAFQKLQQQNEAFQKLQQQNEAFQKLQQQNEAFQKLQQQNEAFQKLQQHTEAFQKLQQSNEAYQKRQQPNEAMQKLQQQLQQQNEAYQRQRNNFQNRPQQQNPYSNFQPPQNDMYSPPGSTETSSPGTDLPPKLRAALGMSPHQQPSPSQSDSLQRLLQQVQSPNQPQAQKSSSSSGLSVEQFFSLVTQQQQQQNKDTAFPPYPPNLQLNLPSEPTTSNPAAYLFGNEQSSPPSVASSLFPSQLQPPQQQQQTPSPSLMSPGGEPFASGGSPNPSAGAPNRRHSDASKKQLSHSQQQSMEAPKPDSPPSGANLLASLFGHSEHLQKPDETKGGAQTVGNQYSLFGESGWNIPIRGDSAGSIGSSPGSSSIRSTPDPSSDSRYSTEGATGGGLYGKSDTGGEQEPGRDRQYKLF